VITLFPETERLARLMAARSGKTPEEVLQDALEAQARLEGVAGSSPRRKPIDMSRIRQITQRVVSRPLLDERTPKDILDRAWENAP
jgi:hypothetical protein